MAFYALSTTIIKTKTFLNFHKKERFYPLRIYRPIFYNVKLDNLFDLIDQPLAVFLNQCESGIVCVITALIH